MPNTTDDKRQKLKDELDSMLKGFNKTFGNTHDNTIDVVDANMVEMRRKESMIDFKVLNPKFRAHAEGVINAMYKFYLDYDVIKKDEYMERKKDMLSSNLTGIFFQLKTVKAVLESVAEEITGGNTEPRLLQAFANLQDKFSDIIKSHSTYIMFLENTVQKMSETLDPTQVAEAVTTEVPPSKRVYSEGYMTADSKKLVSELKPEHLRLPEHDGIFTNPASKPDLMQKLNIDESMVKESNDDDTYESLMEIM
jgi:hypothetical protein